MIIPTKFVYSERRLLIGFAIAAFKVWNPTATQVTSNAAKAATA
jgi:hypothetical protein